MEKDEAGEEARIKAGVELKNSSSGLEPRVVDFKVASGNAPESNGIPTLEEKESCKSPTENSEREAEPSKKTLEQSFPTVDADKCNSAEEVKEAILLLNNLDAEAESIDSTAKNEKRVAFVNRLSACGNFDIFQTFLNEGGLQLFDDWLREIHRKKPLSQVGSLEYGENEQISDTLARDILVALDKLPIGLAELKACKIGKAVNHLKNHRNLEIQQRSRELVEIWKKRVDLTISETGAVGELHAESAAENEGATAENHQAESRVAIGAEDGIAHGGHDRTLQELDDSNIENESERLTANIGNDLPSSRSLALAKQQVETERSTAKEGRELERQGSSSAVEPVKEDSVIPPTIIQPDNVAKVVDGQSISIQVESNELVPLLANSCEATSTASEHFVKNLEAVLTESANDVQRLAMYHIDHDEKVQTSDAMRLVQLSEIRENSVHNPEDMRNGVQQEVVHEVEAGELETVGINVSQPLSRVQAKAICFLPSAAEVGENKDPNNYDVVGDTDAYDATAKNKESVSHEEGVGDDKASLSLALRLESRKHEKAANISPGNYAADTAERLAEDTAPPLRVETEVKECKKQKHDNLSDVSSGMIEVGLLNQVEVTTVPLVPTATTVFVNPSEKKDLNFHSLVDLNLSLGSLLHSDGDEKASEAEPENTRKRKANGSPEGSERHSKPLAKPETNPMFSIDLNMTDESKGIADGPEMPMAEQSMADNGHEIRVKKIEAEAEKKCAEKPKKKPVFDFDLNEEPSESEAFWKGDPTHSVPQTAPEGHSNVLGKVEDEKSEAVGKEHSQLPSLPDSRPTGEPKPKKEKRSSSSKLVSQSSGTREAELLTRLLPVQDRQPSSNLDSSNLQRNLANNSLSRLLSSASAGAMDVLSRLPPANLANILQANNPSFASPLQQQTSASGVEQLARLLQGSQNLTFDQRNVAAGQGGTGGYPMHSLSELLRNNSALQQHLSMGPSKAELEFSAGSRRQELSQVLNLLNERQSQVLGMRPPGNPLRMNAGNALQAGQSREQDLAELLQRIRASQNDAQSPLMAALQSRALQLSSSQAPVMDGLSGQMSPTLQNLLEQFRQRTSAEQSSQPNQHWSFFSPNPHR